MSEMIVERDIAIPMRDGAHLYANLYRPAGNARFPIIVTLGPYGKDLHFRNVNAGAYDQIDEHGPFLNWETPNPEWWVAQNYALLRVDQRGIGRSPGHLTLFSAREAEDFYDAIE